MKYRITILILVTFLVPIGLSNIHYALAQQDSLSIEVKGSPDNRPKLLILRPEAKEPFTNQDQIIQELYDLLTFDLSFSDAFRVYGESPQAAYINRKDAESGAISYEDWRSLRIEEDLLDYILKAVLVPRGEGQFELDVLVYDIIQGNRVIGRAYGGAPLPPFAYKNLRLAGHKATAEIIRTLTDNKIQPITETRFAFVNYNTSKQTKEIYLIDYDGCEKSVRQVTSFNSITQFPDWSPNGNELAFVSYKDNWPDCFIQNLPQGTVQILARFKNSNNTPRWCPDGENLLISLSAEGNAELYVIPKSGKKPKRLTRNNWQDLSPDVSPSGDQVVYVADGIGSPQIYVMSIDGSNIRRISYINRKCESPFWSPIPLGNDYKIAFSGYYDSQQSDIYTIRPDGTDLQMITDGKYENLNPTWSPNGRYIAFSSNRSGKHEIYIASSEFGKALPNGERFYRVTHLAGENLNPAWSPN